MLTGTGTHLEPRPCRGLNIELPRRDHDELDIVRVAHRREGGRRTGQRGHARKVLGRKELKADARRVVAVGAQPALPKVVRVEIAELEAAAILGIVKGAQLRHEMPEHLVNVDGDNAARARRARRRGFTGHLRVQP